VEGDLPPAMRPIIPGHEVVGVIDRLGSNVRGLKEGDRVGVAWLQETCGVCRYCLRGAENLCPKAVFTGYHRHGGYAEYLLVPSAFAYPIPPIFTDDEAAPLLCAGIIGYRALRRSDVKPGQRLGMYGFGASAHLTIQIARHWGCEVYVCSLREEHRRLARDLGAVWVGGAAERPPDKLDAAILFAPAGELVPPALQALDKGGTLAVAGIHMTPIPEIDYDRDLFDERSLRSVTANTKQDGLDFLREAAAIPIRAHTQRFRLDQANEALQSLKASTIQGAAVLAMD
jgi:propanol-preferring alcohol dehydrogenase